MVKKMVKKKQQTKTDVFRKGKIILKEMQNGSTKWDKVLAEVLGLEPIDVWRTVGQIMKVGILSMEAVQKSNKIWTLEEFE
jgi:hypothetical protein